MTLFKTNYNFVRMKTHHGFTEAFMTLNPPLICISIEAGSNTFI